MVMTIRAVVELRGDAVDRVLDVYTLSGPPPLTHHAVHIAVGLPGGPTIQVRIHIPSGHYEVALDSPGGAACRPTLLAEGRLTDAL
jgi:hypothetical protein